MLKSGIKLQLKPHDKLFTNSGIGFDKNLKLKIIVKSQIKDNPSLYLFQVLSINNGRAFRLWEDIAIRKSLINFSQPEELKKDSIFLIHFCEKDWENQTTKVSKRLLALL